MYKTSVYVINLDASDGRLASISERLLAQNLSFVRVPAVDGRSMSSEQLAQVSDDRACRREMGRSIQPGEVGCFLSHRKALEAFLASGDEFAVVLEDDAVLSENFRTGVEILCELLRLNPHVCLDSVNLGPSDYKYVTKIVDIDGFEILQAHRFPMLATGLLWTRKGAELVCGDGDKIKFPFDNYLRFKMTRGRMGGSVRPRLITAAEGVSDIEMRSSPSGRSRKNRSRLYFLKKQRRIIREKIVALASMVAWKFSSRRFIFKAQKPDGAPNEALRSSEV